MTSKLESSKKFYSSSVDSFSNLRFNLLRTSTISPIAEAICSILLEEDCTACGVVELDVRFNEGRGRV